MKRRITAIGTVLAATLALAGCGDDNTPSSDGEIKPREISWLLSRPADGSVITVVQEIADEYAEMHPGFSLNLITTPDRPSYLQKYETLAAANQLPELFDTDATPFTKKLIEQDRLVDVEDLLKELGTYDSYRPLALDYQRFDDGSLYMMPFEFEMEYFFYNRALFDQAGVSVPETLDDLADLCGPLRDAGLIPIAMDGQDGWPLERYVSYVPFRLAGPQYLTDLKQGDAAMGDDIGTETAEWMAELGANECFTEGFSSQGYTDARDLFTSGQAAIYQVGTWELPTLAGPDAPAETRDNIDYFTLPSATGAVTEPNEYTVVSGIGTAINAGTFDALMKDFVTFLLEEYPARIAETGRLSPVEGHEPVIPDGATELYARALAEVDNLGDDIAFPWDTQLDPTTNTLLQQELTLLVQGEISPGEFTDTIDDSIEENAPKFFD